MSIPTPLLTQFQQDVAAYKEALWGMKVAAWRARKFERVSWRTIFTTMGVSQKTAMLWYEEVEEVMGGSSVQPDYRVVDLNTLPEGLRKEVLGHLT